MKTLNDYLNDELLVVGVGNPSRGDDAAGLLLGEQLARKLDQEYLHCEEVPESYLGQMLDSVAATVLLVDAVDMKKPAGEIALLSPDELAGTSISTHNCSVTLLAKVLEGAKDKKMVVLGIQPQSLGWGQALSPAVAQAIDRFVQDLSQPAEAKRSAAQPEMNGTNQH